MCMACVNPKTLKYLKLRRCQDVLSNAEKQDGERDKCICREKGLKIQILLLEVLHSLEKLSLFIRSFMFVCLSCMAQPRVCRPDVNVQIL